MMKLKKKMQKGPFIGLGCPAALDLGCQAAFLGPPVGLTALYGRQAVLTRSNPKKK